MTTWLLTWLWQGLALTVGISIVFRSLPRLDAATRYLIWWGALVALVWLGWASSPQMQPPMTTAGPSEGIAGLNGVFQVAPLPPWLLTTVISVWVTIALIRLLRVIPGLHSLYALNDSCRGFPQAIEEQLPLWQQVRASGRSARLMICDDLSGPAVIGLHRPCIALPSSLLGSLAVDELDQIILHEYAHVQRRDDWIRLAQTLLEAAVWIHPATIWLSRGLNLEREVACDDWVIARTGSPKNYARCLSRAAEVRGRIVQRVIAPALFSARGDLLRRIDRLLIANRNVRKKVSTIPVAIAVCALAIVSIQLRTFPLIVDRLPAVARSAQVGPSLARRSAQPKGGSIVDRLPAVARSPKVGPSSDGGNVVENSFLAVKTDHTTKEVRLKGAATASVEAPISVVSGFPPSREALRRGHAVALAEADSRTIIEAHTPSLIDGRSFQGIYRTSDVQSPVTPRNESTPWRFAEFAGVGIGIAARTTTAGLARTVARARVSLARSF
jgi:beta-lactamase regulating signal transducer with metallopeptidase domain